MPAGTEEPIKIFKSSWKTILTDNISEFSNPKAIEFGPNENQDVEPIFFIVLQAAARKNLIILKNRCEISSYKKAERNSMLVCYMKIYDI